MISESSTQEKVVFLVEESLSKLEREMKKLFFITGDSFLSLQDRYDQGCGKNPKNASIIGS